MNKTLHHLHALIAVLALLVASVATIVIAPSSAADLANLPFGGTINADVSAGATFSIIDGRIMNKVDFPSIILKAYFSGPPNWMVLPGGGLCNVTYKASWENQSRTIYQWSFNSPGNWADDDPNPKSVFSYALDLGNVPLGPQQIEVTASGVGYTTNFTHRLMFSGSGSSSIHFTVAGVPPAIDVVSPENKEYNTSSIPLVFYTKEETIWLGYSLDNAANVTTNGNTTLIGLGDGYHSLSVYGNGTKWNAGKSSEVIFKVDTQTDGNNSIPTLFWKTSFSWDLSETPARDLWEPDIRGKYRSWTTPTVFGGIVYAGLASHVTIDRYASPGIGWIDVYAFNATTGAKIWNYRDDSSSQLGWAWSSRGIRFLTVVNGIIYFGLEDNEIYALDASSGTLLWNDTTHGIGHASPAIIDDVVYIGGVGTVYALNAANGDIFWGTNVSQNVAWSSPAVANGMVYITSFEGVHAMNARTGDRIWDYYGEDFHGTCLVANGAVYAGSFAGNVYAFDALSGAKIWNHTLWDGWNGGVHPTAIRNDILYANSPIHPYALNAKNGATLWNATLGYEISTPKLVDNIVCLSSDSSLITLNAETGETLWNYTLDVRLGEPMVANGVAYLSAGDQIYAIGLPSASRPVNETFPTVPVAVASGASAIAIAAGIVVYFKKRKRQALSASSAKT